MIAVALAAALSVPRGFAGVPLPAALREALAISPEVAQARARVAESAALLAAARGSAAPALTANYAQAPQGGNANNTITQRLFTLGAQVTLGDYLSYLPAVREAAFGLTQAQFDMLAAKRAERLKVVDEYYSALKSVSAVALREQDASGAASDLRAAQLRFRAGDVPRLDVVRAQVTLAQTQAALDSARVQLSDALDALAQETGEPLARFAALAPAAAPAVPRIDSKKAVARALAMRSDLRSAQQAVGAERAAVELAQRGILPLLTVSAGYTRGVDSGVNVAGPSANVNLAVPVSHAASDRVAAERARLAAARARREAVRRAIVLEVESAVRAYEAGTRAVLAAARARSAAEQELRATRIGYGSGASSSLDVAVARRTYVQAALNELNAVYDRAASASKLLLEMEE